MMASDNNKAKAKADAVPKKEAVAKNKSTPAEDAPKVEGVGSETPAAASSNYSRGEGQKPVTRAYKENWNAIFAKKKKR
jgi:hypothetical protein